MKSWRRFLLVAALLVLGAVAGFLLTVWSNPIGLAIAGQRRALGKAGLEKATLAAPGGRLTYWRGGSGPALVLAHGMGGQAGMWAEVASQLAAGHRLLVPDLPGHGESGPAEGPLTPSHGAAGLAALLEAELPGEPATLVGNSWGGWVSLLFALERPERVARLVLVNSSGILGSAVARDPEELTLLPKNRQQARNLVAATSPARTVLPPGFVLDDLVEKIAEGPTPRILEWFSPDQLLDDRLAALSVPAELIWGEEDRMLDLDYARSLVEVLPAARLHLLPTCAHIPQMQCPEAFVRLLEEVLAEAPPEARRAAEDDAVEEAGAALEQSQAGAETDAGSGPEAEGGPGPA